LTASMVHLRKQGNEKSRIKLQGNFRVVKVLEAWRKRIME